MTNGFKVIMISIMAYYVWDSILMAIGFGVLWVLFSVLGK